MAAQKRERSELREWIQSIVIAVVLAFVIKMFLFDFVLVQGSSMFHTLKNGDRLVINKIEYSIGAPDYGDIVVLNYSKNVEYVKRVIAKGGDTIAIKDQIVYLNGQPLDEAYVNPDPYEDFEMVTVPEWKYFVMGDNRANSSDSRYQSLGFVDEDAIIGHVIFRFWPLNTFGVVK
ncbi:signal peptidase I [Eubacterium aggregans]|uniref:signal peptidase I n=1 Tax=Eubacterium aggregans TaxID=81409 RepID=UPI003F3E8282